MFSNDLHMEIRGVSTIALPINPRGHIRVVRAKPANVAMDRTPFGKGVANDGVCVVSRCGGVGEFRRQTSSWRSRVRINYGFRLQLGSRKLLREIDSVSGCSHTRSRNTHTGEGG